MKTHDKLLPLGSLVYLEGGNQKLVVIGRGVIYQNSETNENNFADYIGAIYPAGLNLEQPIFFQHENIDKIIFTGYSDDEEERFMELYMKWQSEEVSSIKRGIAE